MMTGPNDYWLADGCGFCFWQFWFSPLERTEKRSVRASCRGMCCGPIVIAQTTAVGIDMGSGHGLQFRNGGGEAKMLLFHICDCACSLSCQIAECYCVYSTYKCEQDADAVASTCSSRRQAPCCNMAAPGWRVEKERPASTPSQSLPCLAGLLAVWHGVAWGPT